MANVFRNLWLKIASLLAAVCLSLIVNYFFADNGSNNSVLQFIVPVELKNVPADRLIIWPPDRRAEVTLQGPTMFLSRISNPIFRISLPPDAQNRFLAQLRKEDLNLPPYVNVISIKPPSIEFTLDKRITRRLPVVVPKIGTLPEDLKLDQITPDPDNVEISGPEEEVKNFTNIESVPLDLRDAQQNFRRELDLRVPGTMSEARPRQVSVNVEVSSLLTEEVFSNLTIEIRSLPGESHAVIPPQVSVKISGPRKLVARLTPADLVPYVRVEPSEQFSRRVNVGVDVPAHINVLAVEPAGVDVVKVVPTPETKKTAAPDTRKRAARKG